MPTLGRGDERPIRHNVGNGLIPRMAYSGPDRLRGAGDGAGHDFGVERCQVRLRSATPHDNDHVALGAAQRPHCSCHSGTGASPPWTATGHHLDLEPETRTRQLTQEVLIALGPGTGHQPHPERHLGHGERRVATQQPFGLELPQELCALRRQAAQQRGHVELGEDEADFALRTVEIDRSPQDRRPSPRRA